MKENKYFLYKRLVKFFKIITILLLISLIINSIFLVYFNNFYCIRNSFNNLSMEFRYISEIVNSNIKSIQQVLLQQETEIESLITYTYNMDSTLIDENEAGREFSLNAALMLRNNVRSLNNTANLLFLEMPYSSKTISNSIAIYNETHSNEMQQYLLLGDNNIMDALNIKKAQSDYFPRLTETKVYKEIISLNNIENEKNSGQNYIYFSSEFENEKNNNYKILAKPLFYNNNIVGVTGFAFYTDMLINSIKMANSEYIGNYIILGKKHNETTFSIDSKAVLSQRTTDYLTEDPITLVDTGNFNQYQQGNNRYFGFHADIDYKGVYPIDEDGEWVLLLLSEKCIPHKLLSILEFFLALFIILTTVLYFYFYRKFNNLNLLSSNDIDLIQPLQNKMIFSRDFKKNKDLIKKINTLTNMEKKIFSLYLDDYTQKEVAQELFISLNTVKSHSKNIYTKLGISGKGEMEEIVNLYRHNH